MMAGGRRDLEVIEASRLRNLWNGSLGNRMAQTRGRNWLSLVRGLS